MSSRDPSQDLCRRAVLAAAVTGAASPAWARRQPRPAGPEEPSPEAVLARPEAYNPFSYALVVQWLWARGRLQQAAFWFYVFQARTRPWARADKQGDGAAALRSALNEELGSVINAWVASDPTAWRALAERAVAYERRLPLSPERPPGLTTAAWLGAIEMSRSEYATQLASTFDSLEPDAFAAKRREAGLYVGAWRRPGPPLLETWR